MIVDDRHDFPPQRFNGIELVRIEDAEAFAEDPIADLDRGPGGEVIWIGADDIFMSQKNAENVIMNRVERDLLQDFKKLLLIPGLYTENLREFNAIDEFERLLRSTRLRHAPPPLRDERVFPSPGPPSGS